MSCPQWLQSWCLSSDTGQTSPCLDSDSDHCSGRAWPCHSDSALQSPRSLPAPSQAGSAGCSARLSLLSPLLLGKLPWLIMQKPLWHLHGRTGNRATCKPLSPPSKICHDRSDEGSSLTCQSQVRLLPLHLIYPKLFCSKIPTSPARLAGEIQTSSLTTAPHYSAAPPSPLPAMALLPPPKESRLKTPCFQPGTHGSHGWELTPTRAVTPVPAARRRAHGTQRGELSRGHRALCSAPSQAGTDRLRRRGGDKERAGSTAQTRLSSRSIHTRAGTGGYISVQQSPARPDHMPQENFSLFSLPSIKCHGVPRHKKNKPMYRIFQPFRSYHTLDAINTSLCWGCCSRRQYPGKRTSIIIPLSPQPQSKTPQHFQQRWQQKIGSRHDSTPGPAPDGDVSYSQP